MEVKIDITQGFENDLARYSTKEQSIIKVKLNNLIEIIRSGNSVSRHLYKPHKIQLIKNLESSLYIFNVNKDIRIILTSDKDPLFNQHLLTLYNVLKHKELDKSYGIVVKSIYQSFLLKDINNGSN